MKIELPLRTDRGWGNLFLTVLAMVSVVLLESAVQAGERPNILVILLDDMGYGDPGCFNPRSKIATPNIDALSREGMRFTDAHAPGPLCHLSRYGLMTGRYPFRTDVSVWPKKPVIEPEQMTIATLARSQGYQATMVGKWHLGFQEEGYENPLPGGPVDCGFQDFFGIRASTDIPPYFYIRNRRAVLPPTESIAAHNSPDWSPIQGAFWRAGGIAPDLKLDQVLPRFTQEAVEQIRSHASKDNPQPFFLYLAYPGPHTPWLPEKSYRGRSGAGLYGDFMMMVDDHVGQVLRAVREAGWERNTLVILTSDNGPVWYEEDVKRFDHDSAGPWRGMKSDGWEAGHRMPMIVRWPEHVAGGTESEQLVCFTDLLATFAELFEVTLPLSAGPDSFSFLPALTGTQPELTPIRKQLVMRAGSDASLMMIRSGEWKLLTGLGSGGFSQPRHIKPGPGDPAGQLYNLATDPQETKNLYSEHPEIVARLTGELQTIRQSDCSRTLGSD